jgi:hypothetical protein
MSDFSADTGSGKHGKLIERHKLEQKYMLTYPRTIVNAQQI